MVKKDVPLTLFFSLIAVVTLSFLVGEDASAITAVEYDSTDIPALAGVEDCVLATVTGFRADDTMVVWLMCQDGASSDILIAIDPTANGGSGAILASSTSAIGTTLVDGRMISAGEPDSVLIVDFSTTPDSIEKWKLNGTRTGLVQSGAWSHSSCTNITTISMDASGYIWVACGSADIAIMMNPVSMGTLFATPSLDDGGALDCGNIEDVGADAFSLVAYVFCSDAANEYIVSFTYTHTATGWAYGGKVAKGAAVATQVYTMAVDGFRNRILLAGYTSGGLDVWSFDNAGTNIAITSSVDFGGTVHSQITCEPYTSGLIICGTVGTGANYEFYAMNSTTTEYLVNVICGICTTSPVANLVGGTNFVDAWAVGQGTTGANGAFLLVEDVAADYPYTPLTPDEFDETCESGSDADCDLIEDTIDNCPDDANNNQTDTDGDGWGDVCDFSPGGSGSDVGTGNYNPGSWSTNIITYLTAGGALSAETAGLIMAILIHAVVLLVPVGITLVTKDFNLMVWVVFIGFGSVLSLSLGFLPINIFMLEVVSVVALMALGLSGRVLGKNGGG